MGDEFEVEELTAFLRSQNYDAYPTSPTPGTPRQVALDQWRQELRGADLYIVTAFEKARQSWHLEMSETLNPHGEGLRPAVLPIVHSSYPLKLLPAFVRNFVPLRYETFNSLVERLLDIIPTLLASRSVPGSADPGSDSYIAEVTLDNFFAFREQQVLDLKTVRGEESRWTVVLGDNGTGKTTLLRAIAAHCAGAPEPWFKSASDCSVKVVRELGGTELLDSAKPTCFGYGAGRRPKPASLSAEAAGISATLFDDHVELPDAEEWILQSDHVHRIAEGVPAATKHFQQVKAVLIELLPDVTDIRVESADGRTRVSVQMQGEWFPMSSMSLGYKTSLTWIVDLARRMFERFPDSEDPLKEAAVVLVDEIDLHLHPKWQRSLLKVLDETFPRVQFIVTAHSPLIVQAAPHANLVLLRREGDRIVIENDLDYIRDWRVDQILASELFDEQPVHSPRVQQLLKARAELIEAGPHIDTDRLRKIDEELDELPTAALPEDQKAMDLIRRAAKAIQSK